MNSDEYWHKTRRCNRAPHKISLQIRMIALAFTSDGPSENRQLTARLLSDQSKLLRVSCAVAPSRPISFNDLSNCRTTGRYTRYLRMI